MLSSFSNLRYKSTLASLAGTLITFLLAKGYLDSDWAMLISGLLSAFFGTVNFSRKK